MLSKEEYIIYSLEYNLFFARLMKEHLIFMESGFSVKDSDYILEAHTLKTNYENFLLHILYLINDYTNSKILISNELVTPYTLAVENITQFYTGICINTEITRMEMNLIKNNLSNCYPDKSKEIQNINSYALNLVEKTINFKTRVISNVLNCKLFNRNYPTLLNHVIEEAEFYYKILTALENYADLPIKNELIKKEVFWNHIMEEHALFIRGLLDPSEKKLFNIADNIAKEFEKLTEKAKKFLDNNLISKEITEQSQKATKNIIKFKKSGTEGLIKCEIKSIILPLLADHTLREAYHYLRILETLE